MGNKTILLLNGAPASGKDVSAGLLNKLHKGAHLSFKEELYKIVANFFGVDLNVFRSLATDRTTKDAPTSILKSPTNGWIARFILWLIGFVRPTGMTPRQALIYVSEKVIKPKFGKEFFGKKLLESVDKVLDEFVYVSDSGFIDEIKPLVEAGHNVIVIRLHRNGCTYDGDSRSLLTDEELSSLGIKAWDIENNGTMEQLEEALYDVLINAVISGGK